MRHKKVFGLPFCFNRGNAAILCHKFHELMTFSAHSTPARELGGLRSAKYI